jgi:hypothetical protein
MKKIFLLFMILGLSLMSFVETQAYYYDLDLDTPSQELGGDSLRDFWENNNLVPNHDFSDSSTSFYSHYETNIFNHNTGVLIGTGFGNYTRAFVYIDNLYLSTDTLYLNAEIKTEIQTSAIYNKTYSGSLSTPTIYGDTSWATYSDLRVSNNTRFFLSDFRGGNLSSNDKVYIDNIFLINLTTLNLQISRNRLDYLLAAYKYLTYAETQYNDGYDTGNLDGYATGFTDGTTYGQNEYHTGNYGTLDETTGIPYNDGYNAGVAEELDTNYLLSFVQGSLAVLNAPILPNITLGVFVFIPLFFGFIAFLFRLGGKRG